MKSWEGPLLTKRDIFSLTEFGVSYKVYPVKLR